jgi:DNA mismatch repair protein MutS
MSIAWAIVEYIHETPYKAKTLFATHYHELNELETIYERVKNYHVSVKEVDNKVIFLRKLCPGGVAHSFGIHVARMAGMPQAVIDSAQRKLNHLEAAREESGADSDEAILCDSGELTSRGAGAQSASAQGSRKKRAGRSSLQENLQLSFYQLDDPLLVEIKEKIKAMDINSMSPLDAFDALRALKKQLGYKS